VALGRALFDEPRLSGDGITTCRTCHDISTNGATGNTSDGLRPGGGPSRNTPTVFNTALNFRFNWGGEFRTLEAHATATLSEVTGQDAETAARRLRADPAIAERFRNVFGHEAEGADILAAITAFERSLTTPDGDFDRWLLGDAGAISALARAGYALFKSYGCVSCHQGANVGGNLLQTSGLYQTLSDPARPLLRVPSLRNVAATAPYFHDGSAATLPEAVRRMGLAQLERVLPPTDISAVVAFLETLTGRIDGRLVTSPGTHD